MISVEFPIGMKAWDLFAMLKETMLDLYYKETKELVLEEMFYLKQRVCLRMHRSAFLSLYYCLSPEDRLKFPQEALARLFRNSLIEPYAALAAFVVDLDSIKDFAAVPRLERELPDGLPPISPRRFESGRKRLSTEQSSGRNVRKRRNRKPRGSGTASKN